VHGPRSAYHLGIMETRADAIRELKDGHLAIAELFDRLTWDQVTRSATIGDGDWSALDLAGHIAFWEEIALATVSEWRQGVRPRVEEVFAEGGGVDRVNAEDVERKRALPAADGLARAANTYGELVTEIEALSDREWKAKAPYPTEHRRRLGELLGSVLGAPKRPFGHPFAHLPDLEAYVASVRRT
jgi:Mycothiol maleylpyruvate isomerase N-terminal domain